MTLIQARTRALLELEQLFDDMIYIGCGTFCVYVDGGHVKCDRLMRDMKNKDYFETITAMEFNQGLNSNRWDKLIKNCTERIHLQCRAKAT